MKSNATCILVQVSIHVAIYPTIKFACHVAVIVVIIYRIMDWCVLLLIVHGNWSDWTPFGTCSRTCGGGTKNRFRTCSNPTPQHGGRNCEGSQIESMECNTLPCPSKLAVSIIIL